MTPLVQLRRAALASCIIASSAGCAGRMAGPLPYAACEVGDTVLVRDVVYFGRNRPDGGTVTDAEWDNFLDSAVTPRFPRGLTVVSATGQWKGESGSVEQERAEILTIMHAGDPASKRGIAEIAAEYKRRFHQEAVLRERSSTCVSF